LRGPDKATGSNERRTAAYQCGQCTVMFRDPELFTARRHMVKQTEG